MSRLGSWVGVSGPPCESGAELGRFHSRTLFYGITHGVSRRLPPVWRRNRPLSSLRWFDRVAFSSVGNRVSPPPMGLSLRDWSWHGKSPPRQGAPEGRSQETPDAQPNSTPQEITESRGEWTFKHLLADTATWTDRQHRSQTRLARITDPRPGWSRIVLVRALIDSGCQNRNLAALHDWINEKNSARVAGLTRNSPRIELVEQSDPGL